VVGLPHDPLGEDLVELGVGIGRGERESGSDGEASVIPHAGEHPGSAANRGSAHMIGENLLVMGFGPSENH